MILEKQKLPLFRKAKFLEEDNVCDNDIEEDENIFIKNSSALIPKDYQMS